jgi:hypothetical protein
VTVFDAGVGQTRFIVTELLQGTTLCDRIAGLNLQSYSGGCDYSTSDKDIYRWNDCISSIKVLPPER